jgi:hypothetical protein
LGYSKYGILYYKNKGGKLLKKNILIIAGIILGVMFIWGIVIIVGLVSWVNSSTSTIETNPTQAIVLDIDKYEEILATIKDNEILANDKYSNKVYSVEGQIKEIDDSSLTILLYTKYITKYVRCSLNTSDKVLMDTVKKYKVDDNIKIVGLMDSFNFEICNDISLERCNIIE